MVKNQPSSTSASACAQNLHYAHSGFWPIWAYFCPKVLRFLGWIFFPVRGNISQFQGSISNARLLGEHLSQKLPLAPPYNHIFWPKTSPSLQKKESKFFLAIFVKRLINLCAAEFPYHSSDRNINGAKNLCWVSTIKHRKNCECCPGHYLSTSVY